MPRVLLSILLMPLCLSALAGTTMETDGCSTCADVHKVWGLMQEVVAGPDPARTALMSRLVAERFSAVCRAGSESGETVCEMASSNGVERVLLSMTLDDDRRMAHRSHFLWLKMRYQVARQETLRELGNALGPEWRFGQSMNCSQDVWRRGPVKGTFTRIEVRGKSPAGSGCEDRVNSVELLTTTGDFPMPRVF
jgi:hypothetical protein